MYYVHGCVHAYASVYVHVEAGDSLGCHSPWRQSLTGLELTSKLQGSSCLHLLRPGIELHAFIILPGIFHVDSGGLNSGIHVCKLCIL